MFNRRWVHLSGRQGWGWMVVVVGMFLATLGRGAVAGTTVPGDVAQLKRKKCVPPANAPLAVQRAIWATNRLVTLPYLYGGGHGDFVAQGYDCSGTVSFFLHQAGVLATPMSSGDFLNYGVGGPGKWVTVYARRTTEGRRDLRFVILMGCRKGGVKKRGNEKQGWIQNGQAV
ncbi:MAG: hypothetical protein NTZ94_18300 [Verrucomicrobia bacterium]|nr:hypothetical protein [Verrucomicrobiota bacterium]